jgi:C-terminal processing protease CtpA/Prc
MFRGWWFVLAACATPQAVPPATVPAPVAAAHPDRAPDHDPDHARGALPSAESRQIELALIRTSLDTMFAHRLDKLRRHALDESALFAELEKRLLAATSWARYDAAIYDALAKFHDGHLTYHPPSTAAPARGYDSYRLGLATTLAGDRLLIASVDAGSDLATAGVTAGDELVAIDGTPVTAVLERAVTGRVWSRPESARNDYVRTWTTVLYPKGDPPRHRKLTVKARADGAVREIDIVPRPVATHAERVTSVRAGGVAIVTITSLSGGRDRAVAIDAALAEASTAQGLVLDLRGDRGGVDAVGYRVVGDLVEDPAGLGTFRVLVAPETIARRPRWKHLAGKAGADGFSPPEAITVKGRPAGGGFHGPVAVVIDAGCASTCEVVSAALRADLHAVLVGETTAGSSGAPVEVTLPASRGVIAIPTWDMLGADGRAIESDGVVPDVAAVATPDALAAGEDIPLRIAIDRVTGKP